MTAAIDVLVLRGAPCSGKSTLGRGLRKALAAGAVLEVDDLRGMLAQVDWMDRRQHDVALAVALDALLGFLRADVRPAVLIDTFSRSRLTGVQERLDAEGVRHFTLSLWVEPALIAARLEARTTGFKGWEQSRILNEEVAKNRYRSERLLDASQLGPDDVLARALEILGAPTVERKP